MFVVEVPLRIRRMEKNASTDAKRVLQAATDLRTDQLEDRRDARRI
jgi:hypothetical protein